MLTQGKHAAGHPEVQSQRQSVRLTAAHAADIVSDTAIKVCNATV